MFIPTSIEQHSPQQIALFFVHQVKQWRLDVLVEQLLNGQHSAKCQFNWYLQYYIPKKEIEQFLHNLYAIEYKDPSNPYIPFVKMIQYLYGLGTTPSLERSRYYLQQYQERFALTSPDPNDVFLQTLAKINHLPRLLRLQWLASQGNGDAICDLAHYYLQEFKHPEDTTGAINLLKAAAHFGHLRALTDLAEIYRNGKFVPINQDKANHYARRAFLRQVILYPDKAWQIKDLPISGYAERLTERSHIRIYHEMICLLDPEYDFLFAKQSSLVPLVHTPSNRGVIENLKTIIPYFIQQITFYDKEELKHLRLKRALEKIVQDYPLPKIQRDHIHLLLAYQNCLEDELLLAATHVMAIKQPYAYMEVIRTLDTEGRLGKQLLEFAKQAASKVLDEAGALSDYALVYLIACNEMLDSATRYRLQQQLAERFSVDCQTSLQQLINWHLQYCQVRYALYKIHRFINVSARGWSFRVQNQKKAQTAWLDTLQHHAQHHPISPDNLKVIQEAYPLLTNSLDILEHADTIVLNRACVISQLLLAGG